MQISKVSSPVTSHNIHFFLYLAAPEHPHVKVICQTLSSFKATRETWDPRVPVTVHRLSFSKTCSLCSLTAGGSTESLSCPKLNFQCFVADKRKRCHLSDNRRMEEAEIKGFRAMLALSCIEKFAFESPQKMLRHQGCGHWTHARLSLQLFVFRTL